MAHGSHGGVFGGTGVSPAAGSANTPTAANAAANIAANAGAHANANAAGKANSAATAAGGATGRGKINVPIEKEGWLLKRRTKSMGSQPWQRRWFWIRRGKFGWDMQGKDRGTIVSSEPMNVLLLHIRHPPSDLTITERRFIFEIISSSKTFLLQAESEDEVQSWITILTNARKHAVEQPSKWLDDEKRARDAAQRQPSVPQLPSDEHAADDRAVHADPAGAAQIPKGNTTDPRDTLAAGTNPEVATADQTLGVNRRRAFTLLEENQKYRAQNTADSTASSSESLSQDVTEIDGFKYSDRLLERKNDELHVILPHYAASLENRASSTKFEVRKDERVLDGKNLFLHCPVRVSKEDNND
jgi:hypothetical protein